MSLRHLAEKDLQVTLEDDITGFGWPIVITPPDGTPSDPIKGYSNDIAQVIDPDTGMLVAGRNATVAIRISTLNAKGIPIPYSVADSTKRPWLITVANLSGEPTTFKIKKSNPDRGLGLITLILENWRL